MIRDVGKRIKGWHVLAAVLALHLAVTVSLVPPSLLSGGHPIAVQGYALHFSRAVAADQLLSNFHRIWGYNPFFMAGYPAGTVFDVNNHFIEIAVFALHGVGVSLPVAFNLLVFGAILLAPVFLWLAARSLRLTAWQQAAAAAMAMVLWLADYEPGVSLTWRGGVIASGVAMYSLPFSLCCLYRYAEDRRAYWYVLFLVSGALASLLHPLSFLFFYAPVAVYFVFRARRYDRYIWAGLAAFAVVVLLLNLFWIVPFLQHAHLKTASGYHWIGGLSALREDLLGVHHSGLRFPIYLLGCGGLWVWWQGGRKELVRFILVPVLTLTFVGYVVGDIGFLKDLETYRNNLLASFLLILPASVCLTAGVSYLRGVAPQRRWVLAGLVLLLGLQVSGRQLDRCTPYLRGRFAQRPLGSEEMRVVDWLQTHAEHGRRVVVEFWPLGALLPWYTGHEVIGGPHPLVWMPHNFVNFVVLRDAAAGEGIRLFGQDIGDLSAQESATYLSTYNVGWIVAYNDESKKLFDSIPQVLSVADFGRYRVYQNTVPSTFFLRGKGKVRAEYGELRVTEASKGELVLKYHWAPTLVTDPPQELVPHTVLDDPVPFIKVPDNRFDDFAIRDRSMWSHLLGKPRRAGQL